MTGVYFLVLGAGGGGSVYSPSTWSWPPSALPVLLYVPLPVMPLSLPVPPVYVHVPSPVLAPSLVVTLPVKRRNALSPLSMVMTTYPRSCPFSPLTSLVMVAVLSLDFKPSISRGVVQVQDSLRSTSACPARSPTSIDCC